MENKNYGMNVIIKLNKLAFPKGSQKVILKNVTEIHYHFPPHLKGYPKKIAFESVIHKTGITYRLADIDEFETEMKIAGAKLETSLVIRPISSVTVSTIFK